MSAYLRLLHIYLFQNYLLGGVALTAGYFGCNWAHIADPLMQELPTM